MWSGGDCFGYYRVGTASARPGRGLEGGSIGHRQNTRASSGVDGNCTQCHQPGGGGHSVLLSLAARVSDDLLLMAAGAGGGHPFHSVAVALVRTSDRSGDQSVVEQGSFAGGLSI